MVIGATDGQKTPPRVLVRSMCSTASSHVGAGDQPRALQAKISKVNFPSPV